MATTAPLSPGLTGQTAPRTEGEREEKKVGRREHDWLCCLTTLAVNMRLGGVFMQL